MSPFVKTLLLPAPTYGVIAVGWGLAWWKDINFRAIADVLLSVAIPALVLESLVRSRPALLDLLRIGGGATLIMLGVAGVAFAVCKVAGITSRGTTLAATFPDGGGVGLSFIGMAWGAEGMQYGVLYYIALTLTLWTFGLWLLQGKQINWKSVLRVPALHATLLGLLSVAFGWTPPALLMKTVHLVGQAAVPLLLLGLGYSLRRIRLSTWRPGAAAVAVRILGGAVLSSAYALASGITGAAQRVLVLISSMPTLGGTYMLAEAYDARPDIVSTAVLISTLLGVLYVPPLMFLLNWVSP